MYKTTKQFVETYFRTLSEQEAAKMSSVLFVLERLLKTHTSLSTITKVLQDSDDDQLLMKHTIQLMDAHGKATYAGVKKIREYMAATMSVWGKHFSVAMHPGEAELDGFLEKRFGTIEMDHKQTKKVWVSLVGEWYYFNRDVERDIDILLA